MAAKPTTVDEILAAAPDDKRAALERLRRLIRAAAPGAEESICYGLPGFRLGGKSLVAYAATAKHCAFYPMTSSTVAALAEELKDFDTSKGTIRFAAGKPLPAAVVRKLVKARVAQVQASAGKPQTARAKPAAGQSDPAVDEFLRGLEHPLKREITAARKTILGVSPEIGEGVKWKAPSFRTSDYFATVNLRATGGVQLIFHLGAKKRDLAGKDLHVTDPGGLVTWLAKDRFSLALGAGKAFDKNRPALAAVVREWIRFV